MPKARRDPWRRPRDLFGTPVAMPVQDEGDFQRQVLELLALELPAKAVVIHIPNGGPSAAWRAKCAALGMMDGAPDLVILYESRALMIECKRKDGYRSVVQLRAHDRLRATGIPVFTARTLEGVEDFLRQNGMPLRGRVAA